MQLIALDRIRDLARSKWLAFVRRCMARSEHELEAEGGLHGGGLKREFFAPIYVSNVCAARCAYCAFRAGSGIARRTLTVDQTRQEVAYLAQKGYTHVYCLTGSFNADRMTEVNARGIRAIVEAGMTPVLESGPFEESHLAMLWSLTRGTGRHTLFQEVYDESTYRELHGADRWKCDPNARLRQHEHAVAAGWNELGIGALLGLGPDLQMEIACILAHHELLMQELGVGRVAISVPRLQSGTGVQLHSRCPDSVFFKAVLTLRILAPHAVLVLTARERAEMRDRLWPYTNSWGAAGSTEPGGYTLWISDGAGHMPDGQFDLADRRSLAEIWSRHGQTA